MAKLKAYNHNNQRWEEVIASTETVVYSGNPSHYTEILTDMVDEETQTDMKLDKVIKKIGDDITTLQGNVAWLAKHGTGGGGGGGGGSTSNYAIEVLTPISDDILSITSSASTITFRVVGGLSSESIRYQVFADGFASNSSYKSAFIGDVVTCNFSINNKVAEHNLVIDVIDPNGMSISRRLRIVESSLNISMGKDSAANTPTLTIDGTGNITVYVTNKILNSETTLELVNNSTGGNKQLYTYTSTQQTETPVTIKLFGKDENSVINTTAGHFKVGATYNISVKAQAITGSIKSESNTLSLRVTIYGNSDIVIMINDMPSVEEYESLPTSAPDFAIGEILSFTFRLFLNTADNIYYAVKINTNGTDFLVDGNYYDDTLQNANKIENINSPYTSNKHTKTQTLVASSWAIPSDVVEEDGATVYVKAWSADGKMVKEMAAKFNVTAGNNELFSNQTPKRLNGGKTLIASWDKTNWDINSPNVWHSDVKEYAPLGGSETVEIHTQMNINHINNKINGLLTDPRRLRLQNSAYATIDLSEYSSVINELTASIGGTGTNQDGFTVLFTYKADKHPYNNHTVMLMGENSTDGNLLSGIRVDLEKAMWYLPGSNDTLYRLETDINQNVLNCITFTYLNGVAKITVNGIIKAAKDVPSFRNDYVLPKNIYLGCNYYNQTLQNYVDADIYNLSIYGKGFNDLQMVINSYNNRLGDNLNTPEIMAEYKQWKLRNFFYTNSNDPTTPVSKLFNGGVYQTPSFGDLVSKDNKPPLPVLYIEGGDPANAGFTSEFFYSTMDNSATGITFDKFKAQYFDPNGEHDNIITLPNVSLAIQGTSSVNYRNKNLEIYSREPVEAGVEGKCKLFQPKRHWFPESEFTLKADVVDSSHALNATIGEWINSQVSQIMEDNPAMRAVAANPVVDTYDNSKIQYADTQETKPLNVKHTLEGFPVILLINFNGNDLRLLGIYSFNLGRFSHYNMGFKFLKDFTRKESEDSKDLGCPAIIHNYTEYLADERIQINDDEYINQNEIYSFEFGSDADNNSSLNPTWSQDDVSILKHIGEFKYNGATRENSSVPSDIVWEKCLKPLFTTVATFAVQGYPPCDKYVWDSTNQIYAKTDGAYIPDGLSAERLPLQLSLKNASIYYVVANALGMFDSLGKNFTLRTWNANPTGTTKWYPVFYDMDTACGGSNDGNENAKSTAYIDKYINKCTIQWVDANGVTKTASTYSEYLSKGKDSNGNLYPYTEITDESKPNTLEIYRNVRDEDGLGFGAYNLRLWNILRTSESTVLGENSYENIWWTIRTNFLKTPEDFTNRMSDKMGNCGELLYNQDYNEKYISLINGTYGNITMLHGTRVERIRKWLNDRFMFLDGVFAVEHFSTELGAFPYYKIGNMYCGGNDIASVLTFNVSSPCILNTTVGSNGISYRYFLKSYTDTKVVLPSLTSDNKQTAINNTELITKIDNLASSRFQKFNADMYLPNLSEVNVSGSQTMNGEPSAIDFSSTFVVDGKSFIRKIDLSNTKSASTYIVSLNGVKNDSNYTYDKVGYIDISGSNVTSLALSQAPLSYLNVKNSSINSITIESQPFLTSMDFKDCKLLTDIVIGDCSEMTEIKADGLANLKNIKITTCDKLNSVIIANNPALTSVKIDDIPSLETIYISGCTNESLTIEITKCNNLKSLYLNDNKMSSMLLPNVLDNVTVLDLSNTTKLTSIRYDGITSKIEEGVLDLTPFTSLNAREDDNGWAFSNLHLIKAIKFRNIQGNPFRLFKPMKSFSALERIYGNISIENSGIFTDCTKFKLNDEIEVDGVTQMPTGDFISEDFCNIESLNEDLSNTFQNTQCNLFDVYYVLSKCDNVVNLSGAFARCNNIKSNNTNPLNEEMFAHCGNVENMNMLFSRSPFVGGMLSSNLLTPLVSLKSFEYVFYREVGGITPTPYRIDSDFFGESLSGVTTISWFNPESEDLLNAKQLLRNLTSLKTIVNCFNSAPIEFSSTGIYQNAFKLYDCALLQNNTQLEAIQDSFNCLGYGSLTNLLGGNATTIDNAEQYPSGLTSILNSFNIKVSDAGSFFNVLESSFFQKVKNTLTTIGGTLYGPISFGGVKYTGPDGFPYDIFKGCTKLATICGIFSGLSIYKPQDDLELETVLANALNPANGNTTITLPNDVLSDCLLVTDISNLFANINGFEIELTGFKFKNHSLTNVSGLFSKTTIKNGIPLGLFYQENKDGSIKNTITNISSVFGDSVFTGAAYYVKPESLPIGITMDDKWMEDNSDKEEEVGMPINDLGYYYIDSTEQSKYSIMSMPNYFCPPDFFRYCVNETSTNINSAFRQTHELNYPLSNKFTFDNGPVGRIPSILLQPVNKVDKAEYVFSGMERLLPTKWANKGENAHGIMYPSELFDGFANAVSLQGIFSHTPVWTDAVVPEDLIVSSKLPALSNISELWSGCVFGGALKYSGETNTEIIDYQLPENLFNTASRLTNVSAMLRFSTIREISSLKTIFMPTKLPKLQDVHEFMYNCKKSQPIGYLPEFWDSGFKYLYVKYNAFGGLEHASSTIEDYDILKAQHGEFFNDDKFVG